MFKWSGMGKNKKKKTLHVGAETDEHKNVVMSSAILRHKADNLDELANEMNMIWDVRGS